MPTLTDIVFRNICVCVLFLDADLLVRACSAVDVLVSNPPYLFTQDMESLQAEIVRY